ncbi:MAG: glycosyltransferase [Balneolaceae bacterium]
MTKKLILIGPKTGIKGGANVAFNYLLDELDRRNISYTCIDMPGGNYSFKRFFMIASYLIQFAKIIKKDSVISLHASNNSAIVYTILLDVIARITQSRLIIRVFGGQHLDFLGKKKSFLKNRVLKCYRRHTLLLETKAIVKKSKDEFGLNDVQWFPNSRPDVAPKDLSSFDDSKPLKILYLSQVRQSKGIDRMIKLAGYLSENDLKAEISVYGEVFDEAFIREIDVLPEHVIKYKGVVKSEDVYDVLRKSDLMVLPTRYAGEGYPGVIIEAINVMLPVMATKMDSIKELIDHNKDGLLVDFKEEEKVFSEIEQLIRDRSKLKDMHQNLHQKRNQFSSEYWNGDFFLSLVD